MTTKDIRFTFWSLLQSAVIGWTIDGFTEELLNDQCEDISAQGVLEFLSSSNIKLVGDKQ